jgi:hypothetical protein
MGAQGCQVPFFKIWRLAPFGRKYLYALALPIAAPFLPPYFLSLPIQAPVAFSALKKNRFAL